MKKLSLKLRNSKGVVMVVAMLILLAVTAVGLGMITNAALSSTIAKNYKNKIQSFYAADGQMTVLSQEVIDSNETPWIGGGGCGGGTACTTKVEAESYSSMSGVQPGSGGSGTVVGYFDHSDWMKYSNINVTGVNSLLMSISGTTTGNVLEGHLDTTTGPLFFTFSTTSTGSWTTYTTQSGTITPATGTHNIYIVGKTNVSGICNIDWFKLLGCTGGTADSIWPITVDSYGDQQTGNEATKSIDNNTGTRWGTNNNTGNLSLCWIKYNLGSSYSINKVRIMFERANVTYPIEIDVGNTPVFTGNASIATANTYWEQAITATNGQYVTVKLTATTSAGDAWFSFYEIRLFKAFSGTAYSDTVPMGKYKVIRTMTPGAINCFNLATKAYDSLAKWGVVFETPLKQYIERRGGVLVNPYGDTAYVPVTLYDYHSDRSNPEFEQPHTGGLRTHMVQDTLDKDRKPVLGSQPYLNNYIKYWFRSWSGVGGGKGDSTIPIYSYTTLPYVTKHIPILRWNIPAVPLTWGACDCTGPPNGGVQIGVGEINSPENFVAIDTIHTDTAFKNVMILDTLAFWQVAGTQGVYEYQNANFYPIGNRGFGAEWNEEHNVEGLGCVNNYSFSMEMHRTFVMVPGLYFHFAGDDDLWVFINNKLALDLGGLHNTWTADLDLDNLAGLTNSAVYNIDLFFCERHSCSSDILITTNMLLYQPTTTKQRHWQRDYGSLN